MNYGQIRDRIVQRMAEYRTGAAEADGAASISNTTIYSRITDVYRELLDLAGERDATKVADVVSFSYAANSDSIDINAVPTPSLWTRPILQIERSQGTDFWPMFEVTQSQFRNARRESFVPAQSAERMASYAWYREGKLLYLQPVPPETLTLKATYIPLQAEITTADSASSPDKIPAEHHPLISLMVAVEFLREVKSPRDLIEETSGKMQRFLRWASGVERGGPRLVREY